VLEKRKFPRADHISDKLVDILNRRSNRSPTTSIKSKIDRSHLEPIKKKMVASDIIPEFECHRQIGKDKYQFYCPVEIGSFVVQIWTRGTVADGMEWKSVSEYGSKQFNTKFSLTIYENGEKLTCQDYRLKSLPCAPKLTKSWFEENFEKREVDLLLNYLNNISKSVGVARDFNMPLRVHTR